MLPGKVVNTADEIIEVIDNYTYDSADKDSLTITTTTRVMSTTTKAN